MIDERIQELRDSLLDVNEQIQTIQAQADAEKRDLSEDEDTRITELFASYKKTEKEIERRLTIAEQTAKLHESAGRSTEPQQHEPQNHSREEKPQSYNASLVSR